MQTRYQKFVVNQFRVKCNAAAAYFGLPRGCESQAPRRAGPLSRSKTKISTFVGATTHLGNVGRVGDDPLGPLGTRRINRCRARFQILLSRKEGQRPGVGMVMRMFGMIWNGVRGRDVLNSMFRKFCDILHCLEVVEVVEEGVARTRM